jgi:peptidyl-prolyl cis-trans isomerase D
MLDSLRLFAKSWPGKAMGVCLLAGLAGFGINNVITDLGTNNVAKVGNVDITSRDFLRAYQIQMNQVSQQIGSVPSPEEAMSLGIPSMVLQNLAQDAALDQMADTFGLGVSNAKLSQLLRKDTNFAGTLGNFDPSQFQSVLRQSGITEAEYFQNQTDSARRQQLILSLFSDTKLPAVASTLVNRYAADKRTVDYIVVGENTIQTPAAPTDTDLATYLAAHQTDFRTVETRTVRLMALSPETLAATKTIDEAAITAEYERTKANMTTLERRTIQQVPLATPEQIAAFEGGAAAGKTFEALVTENSLTATDIGTLAQRDITDANLATAAFGLAQGGYAVIDGVTGKRAIHVSAIEAGHTKTAAEAHDEIAHSLALAQAKTEYSDVLDQVEELRAAFKPLDEIATRFGLPLYNAAVTQGGAELAVSPSLAETDRPQAVQAIFKATEGKLTPAITLNGNSNVWFDLEKVDPARDQTLDEVHDAVATAWTTEKVNAAIDAETANIVKRLDAGEDLIDVASALSLVPQASLPFTRFGEANTSIDGPVAAAAFAGGPDHHGSAVNTEGDHIVFQVSAVTPADGPLETQQNASLENEARIGLYGDFVTAVRDEAGLRINQQALTQTLQLGVQQ